MNKLCRMDNTVMKVRGHISHLLLNHRWKYLAPFVHLMFKLRWRKEKKMSVNTTKTKHIYQMTSLIISYLTSTVILNSYSVLVL